jgi:hypothetical protein
VEVGTPIGFRFETRKNGDVIILHKGHSAAVLRGNKASAFLVEINGSDEQEVMARVSGNYKRGNERTAASHRRNRL